MARKVLNAQENTHLHSDDWQRTVYIDTLGVQTTDFDLDDAKKDKLVESGRKLTKKYFKWFDARDADTAVNHPEVGESDVWDDDSLHEILGAELAAMREDV